MEAYEVVVVPLKSKNDDASQWAWVSLTATGIEHVYTGIEGVLKTLVNEVDGGVHAKEEYHKALLAQCLVETTERPAILDQVTHALVDELRGFRHAERNNYIDALRAHEVDDNYKRMNAAMPAFRSDVLKFIEEMSTRYTAEAEAAAAADSEDDSPGDGPSTPGLR